MLSCDDDHDDGDIDLFYDSLDSLTGEDSVLDEEGFGSERRGCFVYDEIWVNEPISVKERRERFLQGMDLAYSSSKVCSQEKTTCFDDWSVTLGSERIVASSGAVSNASISPSGKVSGKLVLSGWNAASEAEVLLEDLKRRREYEVDGSFQEHRQREGEAKEEFWDFDNGKANRKNWLKRFVNIRKGDKGNFRSKLNAATNKTRRVKVKQNKKRWMEFSEVYIGQEIRAHKGLIWTMKFSPNGQYLASGGEDGVVRIWRVFSRNKSHPPFVSLPNDIFQIEESPLQELFGHSSDILDLAWSNSDVSLTCRTNVAICFICLFCLRI